MAVEYETGVLKNYDGTQTPVRLVTTQGTESLFSMYRSNEEYNPEVHKEIWREQVSYGPKWEKRTFWGFHAWADTIKDRLCQ